MKNMIVIGALVLTSASSVADPMKPISPFQAKASEGQCVVVEGRAKIFNDPQRLGVDVQLGTDGNILLGYIPPENKAQFPELKKFDGKLVDITGVVQFHLGAPEIKMIAAYQLMLAPPANHPFPMLFC